MRYTPYKESVMFDTLTNINPKPVAYSGQSFNFLDLDHRVFEILLYQIFKARIENNDFTLENRFDNVVLMQGVGERGRDCFLTKKGKNVGVIQCKQVNKNLNRPAVLKEILKFIIYYTQDKALITDINNFYYYFAVSKGFAETASTFLANFNNNYNEEEIKTCCNKILKEFRLLKDVLYEDIASMIKEVFLKIKVSPITPVDLNKFLFEYDSLIKNFYKIFTVTDNTLLEAIIENYLAPILSKLHPKGNKEFKDFTYRFKDYLQRVYSYYSSSRTLLFGNQQKKLHDFYYPLNLECTLNHEKKDKVLINTANFSEDFLPKYKKVIIIDNGGMGKSTIMKWLFLNVIKERKGIPIFIELRKLINGQTILDEIVNELNPIDKQIEKKIVTQLIEQGNFIFFFDGYDEIIPKDKVFVTTELQSFISKSTKNLFIMTSRPEIALNTFSDFKEFKIKELERNEAFELIKKIGNSSDKSQRLINKIENNNLPKIDDFIKSPLLISLLYKKFEHRENIPINLQEFYYEVFEALFQDHDLTKGDSFIRPKKSNLSFSEFFQILRKFAYFTFQKGEIEYNDAILYKYFTESSKSLQHIKFVVADLIEDLVKNVPLFSKEGLQFRWSHKSFQEYFAAEFICRDTKEKQVEILNLMYNSEKFEKYNFILSLCYDIDYNIFREAIIVPYLRDFVYFYETKFNNSLIHKDIIEDQINLRKILLYNKSILINFQNELGDTFMRDALSFMTKNNMQLLEKYSEYFLPDYNLKRISINNDHTILISFKFNDLANFLSDKNGPFIKKIDSKLHKVKTKEILNDDEIPNYLVSTDKNTDLNNPKLFNFYNAILSSMFSGQKSELLDYKKCKLYLSEYDKYTKEHDNNNLLIGI